MQNHVLVKAIVGSASEISDGESGRKIIDIIPGDIGVMRWVIATCIECPEPRVVWDKDRSRAARKVLLQEVELVGIEKAGRRVHVEFPT